MRCNQADRSVHHRTSPWALQAPPRVCAARHLGARFELVFVGGEVRLDAGKLGNGSRPVEVDQKPLRVLEDVSTDVLAFENRAQGVPLEPEVDRSRLADHKDIVQSGLYTLSNQGYVAEARRAGRRSLGASRRVPRG